jgi:hypothetical protein
MGFYKRRKRYTGDTQKLVKEYFDKGRTINECGLRFGVSNEFDKKINAFYKSDEWKTKRGEIFGSNTRECSYCGSARELQVDHIKPLRFFWSLRLEDNNLQVVCKICNYLKGSETEIPKVLQQKKFLKENKHRLTSEEIHNIEQTIDLYTPKYIKGDDFYDDM